jgi:hypothetical protein
MSEIKVNKVSPATGTAIQLGDSGDVFTIPSGATITNNGTSNGFGGGKLIQEVSVQNSSLATSSTNTNSDDTIPQQSPAEGFEVMSLAISPTDATYILEIESCVYIATTVASQGQIALYKDSTASALAANESRCDNSNTPWLLYLKHRVVAGSTSSQTYKIRTGCSSGTTTFNGISGARRMGGVAGSFLSIKEFAV